MRAARKTLRSLLLAIVVIGVLVPAGAALAEPTAQEIEQQIDKSSTELERVVEDYNKVTEELKQTQAAAADLAAKLGPLEQHLAAATANVSALAAQAYKRGGEMGTVSLLLNGGRPDAFMQNVTSLDRLAKSQQRDIAEYIAARQSYQDQKQKLDTAQAQQTNQQKLLADRKTKIESDLAKLNELKRRINRPTSPPSSGGGGSTATAPAVSGSAGVAVRYAYGALGKPYVWAADGPEGYDCSGLTLAAWRAAGVSLPHNAAMQWDKVTHISRSSLAPGDLVFYYNLGHVGIYVGNNQVIHSPTFGDVVKISSVDMAKPYGYGRVH